MTEPVLEIENLSVQYRTEGESIRAVNDATFTIGENEYFGLVGESGCGKSTLSKAIIGGLDDNGQITHGTVKFRGKEIQTFSEKQFNEQIRWKEISIIPQSSMNSLDPVLRISEQAVELAKTHTDWERQEAIDRLAELFDIVGLAESRIDEYPHQFSGGMQQRVIIALSLFLEPSLIIADEPTTALDVIMQDQILQYLDEVKQTQDTSMLMITHDISTVFETCDSLAVMHGGQIAESGDTTNLFDTPRHPYSILLQQAFPDIRFPDRELSVIEGQPPQLRDEVDYCSFADRCPWANEDCRTEAPPLVPAETDNEGAHQTSCIRHDEMEDLAAEYLDDDSEHESILGSDSNADEIPEDTSRRKDVEPVLEIQNLSKQFKQSSGFVASMKETLLGKDIPTIQAVDGVNIDLKPGSVEGVIGESGCGKSTLLRTLMGLHTPSGGEIYLDEDPVSEFTTKDWKEYRRRVQIIFQDPFNSMDPKFTVRETLREPLDIHNMGNQEERIFDMLERVELNPPEKYLNRTSSQLSGGEKQRVSIARALILEPDVILADEPVSMLDVSTQAAVLRLLSDLCSDLDVSMLYISHDLSTVSYVCDRVNVMYLGRIVESADTARLLRQPSHPYTEALVSAIPVPDPNFERNRVALEGTASDSTALPTGCRFKDRCPERMEICDTSPRSVPLEETENSGIHSHEVACHLHYEHEVEDEMMQNTDHNSTATTDGGTDL